MKSLFLSIIASLAVVFMSGCTTLDSYQTKAAGEIARGIGHYCNETPQSMREGLRADVNEQAAPDSIEITCGNQ